MDKLMPHRPTLGWAIVILVVIVLTYHYTIGRGRR